MSAIIDDNQVPKIPDLSLAVNNIYLKIRGTQLFNVIHLFFYY